MLNQSSCVISMSHSQLSHPSVYVRSQNEIESPFQFIGVICKVVFFVALIKVHFSVHRDRNEYEQV